MSDETRNATVVEIQPRQPGEDSRVVRRRSERASCRHRRVEIDCKARRVYCRECKDEIDAFTALEKLARDQERLIEGKKAAKRALDDTRRELNDAKREERNIKARLRRARGQLEVVEREASA